MGREKGEEGRKTGKGQGEMEKGEMRKERWERGGARGKMGRGMSMCQCLPSWLLFAGFLSLVYEDIKFDNKPNFGNIQGAI